jgi:hypothetical protein
MLSRFLKTLVFVSPLFFAAPAFALLEINVGGQGILSDTGSGNWLASGASSAYSYSGAYGLQADVRLNIPLSDWQFGVRYGQLGLSGTSNGYNLSMSSTTYSGLVAYRIINTGVLFGPVVTYAFGGSGSLQNSFSNLGGTSATAGNVSQYSAGLELGIKFPFLLAVELGYANLTMNNFSSNQQINGSATNVALGGTYARVSIGLSF